MFHLGGGEPLDIPPPVSPAKNQSRKKVSQSWPIQLVLQVILPHNRDSADVSDVCVCMSRV